MEAFFEKILEIAFIISVFPENFIKNHYWALSNIIIWFFLFHDITENEEKRNKKNYEIKGLFLLIPFCFFGCVAYKILTIPILFFLVAKIFKYIYKCIKNKKIL